MNEDLIEEKTAMVVEWRCEIEEARFAWRDDYDDWIDYSGRHEMEGGCNCSTRLQGGQRPTGFGRKSWLDSRGAQDNSREGRAGRSYGSLDFRLAEQGKF
mmetsp:Transcript_9172/g.19268  ORF Transcript_9172/g.19268 Transcript_9172/m.19268 type:complete len:100 (-) Transcript_9172:107-406(-)